MRFINTSTYAINNPCYKCDDRTVGCHVTCNRDAEYKKDMIERKKYLRPSTLDRYIFRASLNKQR